MSFILLSCCYLAPVSHYSAYYRADEVQLEVCDHFVKQTLRNRCYIDSPNGALALTVPVVKTEGKTDPFAVLCVLPLTGNDRWKVEICKKMGLDESEVSKTGFIMNHRIVNMPVMKLAPAIHGLLWEEVAKRNATSTPYTQYVLHASVSELLCG